MRKKKIRGVRLKNQEIGKRKKRGLGKSGKKIQKEKKEKRKH